MSTLTPSTPDRRCTARCRRYLALVRRREGAQRRELRRAPGGDPRHHRPQRRRQVVDAQRHQRRVSPAAGHGTLPGRGAPEHGPAPRRRAGRGSHVPEHRAVQGHDGARQHHDRAQSEDARHAARAGDLPGPQPAGGTGAPCQGRGDHRLPADRAHPQDTRRPVALRPAEARGAGTRAGSGADPAAAGRADGRDERRGESRTCAASSST